MSLSSVGEDGEILRQPQLSTVTIKCGIVGSASLSGPCHRLWGPVESPSGQASAGQPRAASEWLQPARQASTHSPVVGHDELPQLRAAPERLEAALQTVAGLFSSRSAACAALERLKIACQLVGE